MKKSEMTKGPKKTGTAHETVDKSKREDGRGHTVHETEVVQSDKSKRDDHYRPGEGSDY